MALLRGFCFLTLALLLLPTAWCQEFFPVEDVRPGLRGVGKTVFKGDRIEEFEVEILGVLQDFGPKQPIILARLSGGPLAETGILQGMSGSPVYIKGKLVGAVALGFPFSKEPICGIQPIQSIISGATWTGAAGLGARVLGAAGKDGSGSMVDRGSLRTPGGVLNPLSLSQFTARFDSVVQLSSRASINPGSQHTPFGNLTEILTPVSVSGSSLHLMTYLGESMHQLGLRNTTFGAQDLVSVDAKNSQTAVDSQTPGKPVNLQPGSMISVGLVTGDWKMTADGTVTYINGNRVYAFGHRLLGIGTTEMPLAYSDVIASVASVNSSFKLSSPRKWIGTILSDHATAIAGELGRTARTIPIQIAIDSTATGRHDYRMRVVNDRLLTPFLTQAVLAATLDATERAVGVGSLKLNGEIHFEGSLPPLAVRDRFVSDSGLVQQASADAVVSLGFVLGGGFQNVRIKDMAFRIEEQDSKRQMRLAQAWTSAHDVRAGESVDITAVLQGENGAELVKSLAYRVPVGSPIGPLNLTISDASTLNFPDFAGISQTQFKTAGALIEAVNRYRNSESLYVRVWRQQPAFNVAGTVPGGEISDPPPSVALILADTSASSSSGATSVNRGSDIAQLTMPVDGFVVSGAKTIQIEVTN